MYNTLRYLLLVVLISYSVALECRDGFFITSEAFDVDRSSPTPITCPASAEAGCVRLEVDGTFTTAGNLVAFEFWMTACGSADNCTAQCTDEMQGEMLRIIRQVGQDDSITVSSNCSTACCSSDDCNQADVMEIQESGDLLTSENGVVSRVLDTVQDVVDGLRGSASANHLSFLTGFVALSLIFLNFL